MSIKSLPTAKLSTKLTNGKDITFKYYPNILDNAVNPGWQVDCIKAYLGQTCCGYLNISYLPNSQKKIFTQLLLNTKLD